MIGHLPRLGQIRPLLLALVAVCLLPGLATAESIYVRNECPVVVIVQAASVVRGVLRRDPPSQLKPNDITPAITLPGNKIITVHDVRGRVLHQSVVPSMNDDHHYGIIPDPLTGRVKIEPRRPFKPR
jgi:hypothetical protein